MKQAGTAPPATFVVFGALGDVTRRLLVPALVNLGELGLLAPAMMVQVEKWLRSGVSFYLRTGKALAARDTAIVIQFKNVQLALFRETVVDRLPPNRLVVQIRPDEGSAWSSSSSVPARWSTPRRSAWTFAMRTISKSAARPVTRLCSMTC
jgi:glucose-6-phosphate 1-dehydrogenase